MQNMLNMSEYLRLVRQTKYMKDACTSTIKEPLFITNIVIPLCFDDIIHITAKFATFYSSEWKKLKDKKETTVDALILFAGVWIM